MHLSNSIFVVAEDALGLALGNRLVQEHNVLSVWRETNARGWSAIKRDILKYENMARNGFPVLILTDQDSRTCCRLLLDEWFGGRHGPHQNLVLRICVREAEAWLMADPGPLASLLRLPKKRIPLQPETLADPKRSLLALATHAPAKVRKGLLPTPGSTAIIGPEYNEFLCSLVATWDINSAAKRAPSLAKARQRIEELATRVKSSNPQHHG
ncbi:MAG: hypothetical protein WCI95_01555 [bacterium]